MIDSLRDVIGIAVDILKMEIDVPQMGSVSLWDAMLFSLVAGVLLYLVVYFLTS